jgi:hypothetical protein
MEKRCKKHRKWKEKQIKKRWKRIQKVEKKIVLRTDKRKGSRWKKGGTQAIKRGRK